jgi:hypothetical protein
MSKKEKFVKIFDFDGVLSQSEIPVLNAANLRLHDLGYDKKITKKELISYDVLSKIVFRLTGRKNIADEIRNYWYEPSILGLAPPNLTLVQLFNELQDYEDVKQDIVTTRPHTSRLCTLDLLTQYFPNTTIDWEEKLFLRDKSDKRSGNAFKALKNIELKANFLSDDGPRDIALLKRFYPWCDYNYINQPWNKFDHSQGTSFHRVSLDDFSTMFSRILDSRKKYLDSHLTTRISVPRSVVN